MPCESDQVTTASYQILSSSLFTKNTTNSTQGSTKVTWHWGQQAELPSDCYAILYNLGYWQQRGKDKVHPRTGQEGPEGE